MTTQDREAEPRFVGSGGAGRGGYSASTMSHGGLNAGYGGGFQGGNPNGAAGRQIYVANVCFMRH